MACRLCGTTLQPHLSQGGKAATSYGTCVYRCEACQVGYSNARAPEGRRTLFAKPQLNVPLQVAEGLDSALANAFSVRARGSKRARFGSSESEDAVTWTVFQYLHQVGALDRLAALCGLKAEAEGPASLLLWGSPAHGVLAEKLSQQLGAVCDALGENPNSRSEPDIIVAWPQLRS
jgi:hypothetical protein